MDARISRPVLPANDVYTDVNSLQSLKIEDNQDAALKKIAQQFESMFLHEMLKTMRKANEVFEEDSLFNGGDTAFFRDMYDQQLSLNLAQKGTGLADTIYQQMSRQYGKAQAPNEAAPAAEGPGALRTREESALRTEVESALRKTQRAPAARSYAAAVERPAAPVHPAPAAESVPGPVESAPAAFGSAEDFIAAVLPHAKAAAATLGVSPLFLTAQAALETGWGKFVIRDGAGSSTHNLFNIKADRAWEGAKALVSTLEYRGGVPVKEQALFRKYGSFAESFADYVQFLQGNPRYQDALAAASKDADFAVQLQRAGYATDPAYAEKILAIMQQLSADPALAAAQ